MVVAPLMRMLRTRHQKDSGELLDRLQGALDSLSSPFVRELESRYTRLSPREVEICSLVREGLSSQQIADQFSTAVQTVLKQRKLIRRKLGLKGRKTNLTSFLKSIPR
jgi:DNA-binding CsgD family transcriptional regulator